MSKATIKAGKENVEVSFGKGGGPIGQRSQEDLNDLAVMAQESGDPSLLALFEHLPTVASLKKHKTDLELKSLGFSAAASAEIDPVKAGLPDQEDNTQAQEFKGKSQDEKSAKTPSGNPSPSTGK